MVLGSHTSKDTKATSLPPAARPGAPMRWTAAVGWMFHWAERRRWALLDEARVLWSPASCFTQEPTRCSEEATYKRPLLSPSACPYGMMRQAASSQGIPFLTLRAKKNSRRAIHATSDQERSLRSHIPYHTSVTLWMLQRRTISEHNVSIGGPLLFHEFALNFLLKAI